MISNSLTSVSMDPPLVSWCVDRGSNSFRTWMAADEFVIHVLGRTQVGLVSRFATRGGDKFAGLALSRTGAGTPILSDHLLRLRCLSWERHDAGDHVIMLGTVLELEVADGEPLLVADLW